MVTVRVPGLAFTLALALAGCAAPPPPSAQADLSIEQADGTVSVVRVSCKMVVNPQIRSGSNSGMATIQGNGLGYSSARSDYPALAQLVEVDYARYQACLSFINAPMSPRERRDYLLKSSAADNTNRPTLGALLGQAPTPIPAPPMPSPVFPPNPYSAGSGSK